MLALLKDLRGILEVLRDSIRMRFSGYHFSPPYPGLMRSKEGKKKREKAGKK